MAVDENNIITTTKSLFIGTKDLLDTAYLGNDSRNGGWFFCGEYSHRKNH
jgi:hypothetical protein